MMFFQVVLLLGYLYAHLLRRFFKPRTAWVVHLILLGIAAATASVVPADSLKPNGDENLTLAIIGVLAFTIGLPFFALSSTGPLIQAWQSSSHANQSPYRLYALSNLGSMLALLSYPFLIERLMPLADQAYVWTFGFFAFAIGCCWCGWQTVKKNQWSVSREPNSTSIYGESRNHKSSIGATGIWFLLSMAASIVLLATTNLMCQEVASIPFLWILPLSLYLLSFIICFDRPALYQRRIFVPLLVLSSIVAIGLVHLSVFAGLLLQVGGLATVCFAASMICHGELERLKPPPIYLTSFYLWISFGGAIGGIFVCIVAPLIFDSFLEFHVGLLIALLVALVTIYKTGSSKSKPTGGLAKTGMALSVFVALSMVLCSLLYFLDPSYQKGLIFRGRNEYGLAAVVEDGPYRRFINGRIEHGGQKIEAGHEMDHISYYVPGSGVGVAFESYRAAIGAEKKLNVSVIGLGAGAMATWLEPDDKILFYEINPMVEEIAQQHFTFLKNCPGECQVKLGDGRMQLQSEIEEGNLPPYDLIFMDAFSSDSIPIHLLTAECLELYLKRMKPEGVLIAHITNRFIDLQPVIYQHALDHELTPILIDYKSEDGHSDTRWVMLTRNEKVIRSKAVEEFQSPWPKDIAPIRWTDDYSSVAALLDWSAGVDWEKIGSKIEDANRKD